MNLIPRLLHFIWLPSASEMPAKERSFVQQWDQMNSSFGVMIWGEDDLLKLIIKFYPSLLGLWHSVTNKGKRSDIARCLILAKYGGYYIDCDQEPIKPLDHFLGSRFLYSKNDTATDCPSNTKEPIDVSAFSIIIGRDNYSVRPTQTEQKLITNCFIGSEPTDYWLKFVESRIPYYDKPVLNSFGPWALTDYIRKNPCNMLELPSYYFNWIPHHMNKNPTKYTYSLHHSGMKWVESGSWYESN